MHWCTACGFMLLRLQAGPLSIVPACQMYTQSGQGNQGLWNFGGKVMGLQHLTL